MSHQVSAALALVYRLRLLDREQQSQRAMAGMESMAQADLEVGMELLNTMLRTLRGRKRYAVEVHPDYAAEFRIPNTEVIQSWENNDGSITFVVMSHDDLAKSAWEVPGVCRVSEM